MGQVKGAKLEQRSELLLSQKGFRVLVTLAALIRVAGEEPIRPQTTHRFSQAVITRHRVRIEQGLKPRSRIEPGC